MSSSKGIAVVTGAGQGIGQGIAVRLADDGFDMVINDIPSNKENLDVTAELIISKGRRVLCAFGDVSKEEDVRTIIDKTIAEFGSLDVMVANAGVVHHTLLTEMDANIWDRVFSINVRGTMLCYKHAAIQMIKQGRGGRIIGAASIAAKQGQANASVYCSSKFAVRGLTQSAALELGQYGITLNAYAPGPVDTNLLGRFDEFYTNKTGEAKGSWTESAKGKAAMQRIGTPGDVAALVSYLASKEASFITGQSINLDGGKVFD